MALFRPPPPANEHRIHAGDVGKNRNSRPMYVCLYRVLSTVRSPSVIQYSVHTAPPDRGKLVTLIAGKWRLLLFAGNGRQSVYDNKPQRYAEDNRTEFNCRPTQW